MRLYLCATPTFLPAAFTVFIVYIYMFLIILQFVFPVAICCRHLHISHRRRYIRGNLRLAKNRVDYRSVLSAVFLFFFYSFDSNNVWKEGTRWLDKRTEMIRKRQMNRLRQENYIPKCYDSIVDWYCFGTRAANTCNIFYHSFCDDLNNAFMLADKRALLLMANTQVSPCKVFLFLFFLLFFVSWVMTLQEIA